MFVVERRVFASMAAAVLGCTSMGWGATVFTDTFSASATYPGGSSGATYTATDGVGQDTSVTDTWTAGSGMLTYSRSDTGNDSNYDYKSSVLLTNGSAASAGNTAGLSIFTVTGIIHDVPPTNTEQPGLIISGSTAAGGYLLEIDNAYNSDFVLLAESADELLGDEEVDNLAQSPPNNVIRDLLHPVQGHDYALSVTETRPGVGNPSFDVVISDLTDPSSTPFDSGAITDTLEDTSSFDGTQIGYRLRDPLEVYTDANSDVVMPSFGALTLVEVPEPDTLGLLTAGMFLLLGRQRGPFQVRRRGRDAKIKGMVARQIRDSGQQRVPAGG
jgi:hypothetical protein